MSQGRGGPVPSRRHASEPVLCRRDHGNRVTASFQQEQMWFASRIAEGGTPNSVALDVRLRGPLDRTALRDAVAAVVERHEILRTGLIEADGALWQVREASFLPSIGFTDLSRLAGTEREAAVAELTGQLSAMTFDLTRPPVRLHLMRLSDEEHLLLWVVHHIVWDPRSTELLAFELAEAYANRGTAPRPDTRLQYADFAVWQRALLTSERARQLAGYWRSALGGAPVCEIPPDFRRPQAARVDARYLSRTVGTEVAAQLGGFASAADATPFMVLLAAYVCVVHRWSGCADVTVGTASGVRPHRDLGGLIGCFVDMITLRTDVRGDPALGVLAGRVRATVLDAFEHHQLPFARVVEAVGPRRDLGRHPLFQVAFTYLGEQRTVSANAGRLTISVEQLPAGAAQHDLEIIAALIGQELRLTLVYNALLYREETGDAFLRSFVSVLHQLSDPSLRLSELAGAGPGHGTRTVSLSPAGGPPGPAAGPAPGPRAAGTADGTGSAERMPLAAEIADGIMAPVLDHTAVGVDEDFFALGGSSLSAIAVIARVRDRLGTDVSLADFLRRPTAAGLADLVRRARDPGAGEEARLRALLERVEQMSDEEAAQAARQHVPRR